MAREERVDRPTRSNEYELRFASNSAKKGWNDLRATIRGPLAETWDFLTQTPLAVTPTNCPLKGELATVVREGSAHDRWQHKPTAQGDARIWFYVEGRVVYLEQVHTRHPNQTK
jgi:hypothetical protein